MGQKRTLLYSNLLRKDSLQEEIEIPPPQTDENMLTLQDVTSGEPISPLTRLKIFDADSWEDVTLELVFYWKTQYEKVVRCGGGGDMGRDVIAYSPGSLTAWENFQCKHYQNKLNVSQALLEIGKLLYYSHKGEFSVPRKYYFVAPLGVSTDLLNHIMDAEKLKDALINRWDKDCKRKIISKHNVELTDDLLSFIQMVDFEIFDHIPPIKIIELHSYTPFHTQRFGTGIKKRPKLPIPPNELIANEIVYTSELLRAFSDAEKYEVNLASLSTDSDYREEYDSARKNFYAAEDLEKFSRDWLPDNCYQELVDECYESVSSTVKSEHGNGYVKYLATSAQASSVSYTSHPLSPYIKAQDKKGMCHQLVNSKRIEWVKDDK